MKQRARKLALAGAIALVTAEVALHLAPGALPLAYLQRFPGNGAEFFRADVFAQTPVEGVLLPIYAAAHHGPPPADLIDMGVAPRSADMDARAFPTVELPADALGLPNPRVLEHAELVLVGDSFGVAAGVRKPEGLQAALERASQLSVYNLSVAGIGPVQERWLVETIGLAKSPRAVVWLYFSGNDLSASYEPLLERQKGAATWADAYPERRKPFLYLPSVLADALISKLRPAPAPPCATPLDGFEFTYKDGSTRALWFHPDYLRQLARTESEWQESPVWGAVQGELKAVRESCRAHEAHFLFVYVPSTPEVYLPYVARDPELARRTIVGLGGDAPSGTPDESYDALLAHHHAQEEVVHAFCARESIPFLSATPALEELAKRGELGYLVTDTHWTSVGQNALLEPLLALLRSEGVLGQ